MTTRDASERTNPDPRETLDGDRLLAHDLDALDALLGVDAETDLGPIGPVAFYWRVSTDDMQDPVASRQRQLARATQLVEPLGGTIVREYSDIGVSRSLPWAARDGARTLLADLKDPGRGFNAVAVGEGDRSFFGDQLAMIWPQFDAAQVDLYIPDIGGKYDAHELVSKALMALVGLWSEQEIEATRRRVRETMAAAVTRDGRFMGGRAPYGYQAVDSDIPHTHPRKAAEGRMIRVLEVDPEAAKIVQEIFTRYIAGVGKRAIANLLNARGVPCPSARRPEQNKHRRGDAWQASAVGAILENLRYTGYEVWGASERQRPFIDPENPSLGWVLRFARAPRSRVVRSSEPTHPAIVTVATFTEAQRRRLGKQGAAQYANRAGRTSKYPSALRGRVYCALCGRRMYASAKGNSMRFACRARESAAGRAAGSNHPPSIYVREETLLATLMPAVRRALAPENRDSLAVAALPSADTVDAGRDRIRAAKTRAADAKVRIERELAAIDAGALSSSLVQRLNQSQAEYEAAQREVKEPGPSMASQRRAIADALDAAEIDDVDDHDLAALGELFDTLGLTVVYDGTTKESKAFLALGSEKVEIQ